MITLVPQCEPEPPSKPVKSNCPDCDAELAVLVLPYPLEARAEDDLRTIAAEYYPRALDLLGVQP